MWRTSFLNTEHNGDYANVPRLVVLCYDWLPADFTHILHDYLSGIGMMVAIGAIVMNIGKIIIQFN